MTLSTLRHVFHNGRRRRGGEVGVLAAHVEESWALAVLGAQDAETVPDIDQALPVSDDRPVVALVIGHALVPLAGRVVRAVLEDVVHLRCGDAVELSDTGWPCSPRSSRRRCPPPLWRRC